MFKQECDPNKRCVRKLCGGLGLIASGLGFIASGLGLIASGVAMFLPHIDIAQYRSFLVVSAALLGVVTLDKFFTKRKA